MAYNSTVEEISMMATQVELYVVVVLLSVFSVVGVSGNALVLFVFSSKRDGLVSTLFIMVLAVIDLTTCAFIVPFTIVMVFKEYQVSTDIVCKLYQFLITSNVPFSSLVMAAIAVDRYLCICRPFWRVLTVARAKWIVFLLALLVSCLGLIGSLTHGVYQYHTVTVTTTPLVETFTPDQLRAEGNTTTFEKDSEEWIIVKTEACEPTEVHISLQTALAFQKCYNGVFFSCLLVVSVLYSLIYKSVRQRQMWRDQQKTRTLSVAAAAADSQQSQQQQQKTTQRHMKKPRQVTHADVVSTAGGQSVLLLPTNAVMKQVESGESHTNCQNSIQSYAKHSCTQPHLVIHKEEVSENTLKSSATDAAFAAATSNSQSPCCDILTEAVDKAVNATEVTDAMTPHNDKTDDQGTTKLSLVTQGSTPCMLGTTSPKDVTEDDIRKATVPLRDGVQASSAVTVTAGGNAKHNGVTLTSHKNRIANIRMAAMLFVVTLVFVTTFMPALAMTMRLIPFNSIIFYMYFSYSVANPIIYSFMNQNFRKQLSRIFGKRQHQI